MLVGDAPVRVDDEGLRHAVDAPVDTDATVGVGAGARVGITELGKPGLGLPGLVLVVDSVNRNDVSTRELCEQRMLVAARHAPGGEHVHERDLADQILARQPRRASLDGRQRERRHALAEQRGRQVFALVLERPVEQTEQYDGDRERRKRDNQTPGGETALTRALYPLPARTAPARADVNRDHSGATLPLRRRRGGRARRPVHHGIHRGWQTRADHRRARTRSSNARCRTRASARTAPRA